MALCVQTTARWLLFFQCLFNGLIGYFTLGIRNTLLLCKLYLAFFSLTLSISYTSYWLCSSPSCSIYFGFTISKSMIVRYGRFPMPWKPLRINNIQDWQSEGVTLVAHNPIAKTCRQQCSLGQLVAKDLPPSKVKIFSTIMWNYLILYLGFNLSFTLSAVIVCIVSVICIWQGIDCLLLLLIFWPYQDLLPLFSFVVCTVTTSYFKYTNDLQILALSLRWFKPKKFLLCLSLFWFAWFLTHYGLQSRMPGYLSLSYVFGWPTHFMVDSINS